MRWRNSSDYAAPSWVRRVTNLRSLACEASVQLLENCCICRKNVTESELNTSRGCHAIAEDSRRFWPKSRTLAGFPDRSASGESLEIGEVQRGTACLFHRDEMFARADSETDFE